MKKKIEEINLLANEPGLSQRQRQIYQEKIANYHAHRRLSSLELKARILSDYLNCPEKAVHIAQVALINEELHRHRLATERKYPSQSSVFNFFTDCTPQKNEFSLSDNDKKICLTLIKNINIVLSDNTVLPENHHLVALENIKKSLDKIALTAVSRKEVPPLITAIVDNFNRLVENDDGLIDLNELYSLISQFSLIEMETVLVPENTISQADKFRL